MISLTSRLRSLRVAASLPLLVKELQEISGRPRTYVIRSVIAVAFFGAVVPLLWLFLTSRAGDPLLLLGQGGDLFDAIVACQLIAIGALLPASTAGAIALERQRNTLVPLTLTGLTAWSIVTQKLLSRLVPTFTVVVLSLPVMAVAYAYGGVTSADILLAAYMLVLFSVQVGAVGIWASSLYRSPVGAFLGTPILYGAILWALPVAAGFLSMTLGGGFQVDNSVAQSYLWAVFPPTIWVEKSSVGLAPNWMTSRIGWTVVSWLMSLGCLMLAARSIRYRVELTGGGAIKKTFKSLDRTYEKMNRVTGNVQLATERSSLPEDRPVAWYEINVRAMNQARYEFRYLILLLLPAIFCLWMIFVMDWPEAQSFLGGYALFLWPVAALVLLVQGSSLFTGERSRQTMDVLLTTPMPTKQILDEKVEALGRIMRLLAVPLIMGVLIRTGWALVIRGPGAPDREPFDLPNALTYAIGGIAMTVVYLRMFGWMSVSLGLRIHRPTRVVIVSVVLLGVWLLLIPMLPMFWTEIRNALMGTWDRPEPWWNAGALLASPASFVFLNETGWLRFVSTPLHAANVLLLTTALVARRTMRCDLPLRRRLLRTATYTLLWLALVVTATVVGTIAVEAVSSGGARMLRTLWYTLWIPHRFDVVLFNLIVYWTLGSLLKAWSYRRADHHLGRVV